MQAESESPAQAAVVTLDGGAASRLQLAMLLVVVGDVVVVVGSFLPWVRSGTATRNSYASMHAAQRLEVVSSDTLASVLAGWYFLPVIAALVTLGLSLHHVRTAMLAATATALIAAGCSLLVVTSSVPIGPGPAISLIGSVVLVAGSITYARHHPRCATCRPSSA